MELMAFAELSVMTLGPLPGLVLSWLSRAQLLAGIVEIIGPWMHRISALLCTSPGQSLIPRQV